MKRFLTILVFSSALIIQALASKSITLSPNATISLLTCTPGTEIYSKYGHSAIRIQDKTHSIDWTFNYGVFNFYTDHFYLKFVRGETWYQLNVEQTDWFILASSHIGRTTYEQVLNLTREEKQTIFDLLMQNYEPQNRYYLYNFVFDNCATRPYTLLKTVVPHLEQVVADTPMDFEGHPLPPTYRQLIRHYSGHHSWMTFGVDFIFGSDADHIPSPEQRLFLPEQLMNLVGRATLDDGSPLCLTDDTQPFVISEATTLYSPYIALVALLLVMILLTVYDIRNAHISWWFDQSLLIGGFLLGTLAFYLAFFSIHPLVKHNWNILFVGPQLLIPALLLFISRCRQSVFRHLYPIGLCWLCFMLIRIALIPLQSWHWLMLVPIMHGVRMVAIAKADLLRSATRSRTTRFALVLALFFAATGTAAAEPRLTVVISVDGLDINALGRLRGYWQQGGLRTLDEEAHFSSVSFPQLVYGGNETLATVLCGTTPSVHGISSDYCFDRQKRKTDNIFHDNKQTGILTDRRLSVEAVKTLTLTDEFRILHTDRSKIYAVGIRPETTILLAGHAANACAWLEPETLSWATTGYYSEGLPAAADEMNIAGRIEQLSSQPWTPRMDIPMYINPTAQERKSGFSYQQKDVLPLSPAANTLVIELALAIQASQQLGTDPQADMLLLGLNVISPSASSDRLESAEQEDMYIRLNQDLGWFIEQLDKRIGNDNYRLVIFGTPRYGSGRRSLARVNMQTRFFNTERISALCNTYLMAIYGHERWVDGGYANNIFLNRTLIEQKKMRIEDIQRKVSSFLLEAEGIRVAFTTNDLPLLPAGGEEEKLRLTLNKHTAGDVVFLLEPLWLIGTDENKLTDRVLDADPLSPFMLWTKELIPMPDRRLSATLLKDIILR